MTTTTETKTYPAISTKGLRRYEVKVLGLGMLGAKRPEKLAVCTWEDGRQSLGHPIELVSGTWPDGRPRGPQDARPSLVDSWPVLAASELEAKNAALKMRGIMNVADVSAQVQVVDTGPAPDAVLAECLRHPYYHPDHCFKDKAAEEAAQAKRDEDQRLKAEAIYGTEPVASFEAKQAAGNRSVYDEQSNPSKLSIDEKGNVVSAPAAKGRRS